MSIHSLTPDSLFSLLPAITRVPTPSLPQSPQPALDEARAMPKSPHEQIDSLRAQKWPEGPVLPEHYREPGLLFQREHREAQSPPMTYWNTQTREQKLLWPYETARLRTSFALPLPSELAFFGLPNECDESIASSLFSALASSIHQHLNFASFITDSAGRAAAVAEVLEYANDCSHMIADRRRHWVQ